MHPGSAVKHPYATAAATGLWVGFICACILTVAHTFLMGFAYEVMIKNRNPYSDWSELIELGMKIIFLKDLDEFVLDFMLKGMCFYLWFVFILSRYSITPRKIYFLAPLIGAVSTWLIAIFILGPLLQFFHANVSAVFVQVAVMCGALASPLLVIVRERPRAQCSTCKPHLS